MAAGNACWPGLSGPVRQVVLGWCRRPEKAASCSGDGVSGRFRCRPRGHSGSQRVVSQSGQGSATDGIGSDAREVRATSVVLLPSTPASVSIARKQLTADLSAAGVYGEAAGDAALVISELLSNSIKHAWPLPGEKVRAAWMVDDGSVEVQVSDGGGPTRPRQDYPPISALGGRGLGIVERLSEDWGIRADETGQTVWAVLPARACA
jgi:anti-sigma regulatory factor (Ser/Thr protein kinase)